MSRFALSTTYSFDGDRPVWEFATYEEACEELERQFKEELRIDTEENGHVEGEDLETKYDEDWSFASISITFKDQTDVTEWKVSEVMNSSSFNVELPEGYLIAEEKGSKDVYPGVDVYFSKNDKRDGSEVLVSCTEFSTTEGNEELLTETYHPEQDNPTHVIRHQDGVDKMQDKDGVKYPMKNAQLNLTYTKKEQKFLNEKKSKSINVDEFYRIDVNNSYSPILISESIGDIWELVTAMMNVLPRGQMLSEEYTEVDCLIIERIICSDDEDSIEHIVWQHKFSKIDMQNI